MINEGIWTFKLFSVFLHSHLLRRAVPLLYKLYITAKEFFTFLKYPDKSNVAAGRENMENLSDSVMDMGSFSNFTFHRYETAINKQHLAMKYKN